MRDRRTYGLQLIVINADTRELLQLTPRNLNVARAMAEGHAALHPMGHYIYRVEHWSWDMEPEIWESFDGRLLGI